MLRNRRSVAFTLIELLVVIGIIALALSILLPVLSSVRRTARKAMLASDQRAQSIAQEAAALSSPTIRPQPHPLARIKTFSAEITLTPTLSVGTSTPESIYQAKFSAKLEALRGGEGNGAGESEIDLPLPPQIISLADLAFTVNGKPSDSVAIRDEKLIWTGTLPPGEAPVPIEVTYSAVGRGIYALQTPPATILDTFDIQLTTNGSDVRMLELSLQPTKTARTSNSTVYSWSYQNLMFGRPITVDVLGIAPVDRLGELSWLGPMSVVVFGLVLGLVARAYHAVRVDKWMLLMMLGTFTGAYPLMYFAQEFVSLNTAMIASAAIVLAIIAVRAIRSVGPILGLGGITLPAAIVMAITLAAAVKPNLQGILITTIALGLFVLAMTLAPRLHWTNGMNPRVPNPAV